MVDLEGLERHVKKVGLNSGAVTSHGRFSNMDVTRLGLEGM